MTSEQSETAVEWEYAGAYCLALYKKEVMMYKKEQELTLATGDHLSPLFDGLRQGIRSLKAFAPELNKPSNLLGNELSLTLNSDSLTIRSPFGSIDMTPMDLINETQKKSRMLGMYADLRLGFEMVGAKCDRQKFDESKEPARKTRH